MDTNSSVFAKFLHGHIHTHKKHVRRLCNIYAHTTSYIHVYVCDVLPKQVTQVQHFLSLYIWRDLGNVPRPLEEWKGLNDLTRKIRYIIMYTSKGERRTAERL